MVNEWWFLEDFESVRPVQLEQRVLQQLVPPFEGERAELDERLQKVAAKHKPRLPQMEAPVQ